MVSEPGAEVKGTTHVRWSHIFPALVLMLIIGQMGKNSVGITVAFPPFLHYMHLTGKPALIGLLMTAYLVAFGVGQFLWGFVLDRWGARQVAIWGICAWTAMLILTALATSLTQLFLWRIGFGLAVALLWPVPNRYTANWFPLQERGRANMTWIGAIYVGVAVAGILLTGVMKVGGWRAAFWVLALLSVAIALPMILFRTTNTPEEHPRVSPDEARLIQQGLPAGTSGKRGATRVEVLSDGRFWLVILTFVVNSMMFWGLGTWFPSYIASQHVTIVAVGTILSAAFLLAAVFVVIAGFWTDRLMRRAPVGVVSFLAFTVAIWLGTALQGTGWLGVLMVGLATAFAASGTLASWTMLHGIVSNAVVGFSAGFMSGLSNIIAAFAPFLMGLLIGPHANYFAGFGFLAVASLVAGAASVWLLRQGV